MTQFLPLFPLKLVAFPGEQLNLHIFEDRYKQLINECIQEGTRFGIPAYLDETIEYGTEMSVEKVIKEYPDGRMDIVTLARRAFQVTEFINPAPNKLYAGGEVVFLDNIYDEVDETTRQRMIELVEELFEVLDLSDNIVIADDITVFDLGHKIGLSSQKKYQLLQLERESARQNFVVDHLEKTIPVIREMEQARERIRMNGHFQKFDPLDF
jgi:Lon protease-like protein